MTAPRVVQSNSEGVDPNSTGDTSASMDLASLFVSAFAASTILPMSSEVVLGALAVAGASELWLLLAVATAGNTLGAVVNWALGRYAATWRTSLTSLDEAKFQRASRWFNRWGIWCLLLSWLPMIGDPLTLAAGVLRTAFVPSCCSSSRAKQRAMWWSCCSQADRIPRRNTLFSSIGCDVETGRPGRASKGLIGSARADMVAPR